MKAIKCEMCGSTDIMKKDGVYVCEHCGTKYSPEEAKKLMVTVDGLLSGDNLAENGETFLKLGKIKDAKKAFEELKTKYPGDYRGWWGLAKCTMANAPKLSFKAPSDVAASFYEIITGAKSYGFNESSSLERLYLDLKDNIGGKHFVEDGKVHDCIADVEDLVRSAKAVAPDDKKEELENREKEFIEKMNGMLEKYTQEYNKYSSKIDSEYNSYLADKKTADDARNRAWAEAEQRKRTKEQIRKLIFVGIYAVLAILVAVGLLIFINAQSKSLKEKSELDAYALILMVGGALAIFITRKIQQKFFR